MITTPWGIFDETQLLLTVVSFVALIIAVGFLIYRIQKKRKLTSTSTDRKDKDQYEILKKKYGKSNGNGNGKSLYGSKFYVSETTTNNPKENETNYSQMESSTGSRTLKLDFQTILLLMALSAIPLALLAIYQVTLFWLAFLVGVSTMFIVGIGLGIIVSSSFRIKVLRKMFKKNFGFVNFIYGQSIKPIIADLDKDIIKFNDGIYIIDKSNIVRVVGIDGVEKGITLKSAKDEIKFNEGIPSIFFDVNDMIPVEFSNKKQATEDNYRIPTQASATLNKEIAVEKARAMNAIKGRMDMMMLLLVGAIIVNAYLTWQLYTDQPIQMEILKKTSGFVDSFNAILPQLQRTLGITNSTAGG